MFKFKNFKILLLLTLFPFAVQNAWAGNGDDDGYAGTWFTFRAAYSPSATGAGKVYGNFDSKSNAVNKSGENVTTKHRVDDSGNANETNDTYSGTDITLHLFAEASDGWEFVEWQDSLGNKLSTSIICDASGNATSQSSKYGYASVARFQSKNVCARNLGSSQGASDSEHKTQHQKYSYNVNTRVDARYVAVFSKLVKDPVVTAEPLDESLGEASFFTADNQVGDVVTIATHPKGPKDKGYENKFLGWKHNGEYLRDDQGNIIRDNPYSFEVTDNNGGVYYAVYESGYVFHRIRNYVSQNYLVAKSDNVTGTGAVAAANSLANDFSMENDATVAAGSIFEIESYKNTDGSGRLVYDLEVQNKHTKDHYELPSIYIRLNQDADKNAWNFSTSNNDGDGTRLRENEAGVQSVSQILDDRSLWYIEPIDKDLETCENYFSLDPAKLVQVGSDYYTTLRTSWNILFNPEQMTPYVVTTVDETTGTFEMEPLTGNIIPAGTCVIIKTGSNDVEQNRMVPTKTNAASGAVPAGNLLLSSEKYFPNQSNSGNLKPLTVNNNGQLAFSASATSTINGNEAYLDIDNEVILKPEFPLTTLDNLLVSGDTQNEYQVSADLSMVVAVDDDQLLICKDNTALEMPTAADGQIDYLANNNKVENPPHSRNRWVALRLPQGQSATTLMTERKITNFFGKLTDASNAEIQLTKVPEFGSEDQYVPNTYVPASFKGTQTIGEKTYFFVEPQNMEYAHIIWAQWDGTKFVTIEGVNEAGQDINAIGLTGQFGYNDSYLSEAPNLYEGDVYEMMAVVRRSAAPSGSPRLKADGNTAYTAYPLWISQQGHKDGNIITGVTTITAATQPVAVEYYNLMGHRSKQPFPGINIVVTRYPDGTTITTKRLIK